MSESVAEPASESAPLAFRDLTNLDLAVLMREFQQLVGARIEKIYQTRPTEFIFRFKTRQPGQSVQAKDLIVCIPYAIFIAEKETQEIEPTAFVMGLRKQLENSTLEAIEQLNGDRICMLRFGNLRLILEFFGKGNLLLVDSNDIITILLRKEETKQRTVRIGEAYKLPEMKKLAPTKDNIEHLLSKGEDEKVIVVLSRNINVPALYLNELLAAVGIDPKKSAKALDPAEKEKIAHSLSSLSDSLAEGKVSPVLGEDGSYFAIDIGKKGAKKFGSFSELLSEVHKQRKEGKKKEVQGAGTERLLKKLKHQEDRVEGLKKEIEAEGKLGSVILENEDTIHTLVEKLKELRKEGKSWEEIEAELNRIHPVKVEKGKLVLEL